MALEWYLSLGGVEIANSARLAAYLESVGSPLDSGGVCGCETFTGELVGDDPYVDPETDQAPWWDPNVPESGEFAGMLVLSVDGLDDHPVQRTVSSAVAGGATLGPSRTQPRTITITGVLLGATCCGVSYGLAWLSSALEGARCGSPPGCGGADLVLYNCCPAAEMDPEEFAARHRRTLRRVALTDGPRVLARAGDGCTASGGCSVGADILTVEIVLTAATPWLWTDPLPVADLAVPVDDGGECITWCVHRGPEQVPSTVCVELSDTCPPGATAVPFVDGGSCEVAWPDHEEDPDESDPCEQVCRLAACPDQDAGCGDPDCRTPAPPVPPPPQTCYCRALAVNTTCAELALSDRPAWFAGVPIITVQSGSGELRHLTITLYERAPELEGLSCEEVAEELRCDPHSVYHVGYLPPGAVLTLDGQVGRATVDCGTGESVPFPDAWGRDGNPPTWQPLACSSYCVCVESDAITGAPADALVSIAVSGRGY